jgi:hypothetical protein
MNEIQTPIDVLKEEVRINILNATKSKKLEFTYSDAVKYQSNGTKRSQLIIKAIEYLSETPLRKNDYYKFLNAYIQDGTKLNEKYFRHDLEKLHHYYKIADNNKEKGVNPFSKLNYENYVLFMYLKLHGYYTDSDDELFKVQIIDNREYNPLTKVPSVLRGCLPFEVKEYDIKRAFPTFIDIELNSDYRHDVYEKISKSEFAMFLNSNAESKVSIEKARKGLKCIYSERVNEVLTDERYNDKGKLFKDLTRYEKEYIDRFVSENNIVNYVRLHDGVFVFKEIECKIVEFDTVQFSVKESIKPKIENNTISFYEVDGDGRVETCPSMYADFLKQENFIRLQTNDDKIQLLKNTNNVIDFYNHKTDMVSFLENEINESCKDNVRDKLARDNNGTLGQSYTLLKPNPLEYYRDNKERFGLPFKNGFFYFDSKDEFKIKSKPYNEVKGFFAPHQIQEREFEYTDEVCNYEILMQRVSTGVKYFDKTNNEQLILVNAFQSMIGYLAHNFKPIGSPCVVLTDEGADNESRNGRRAKSLVFEALQRVTKTMFKGENEFNPDYEFRWNDLDKSYNLFCIDDAPAGFKYQSLYTTITGGINVQKKGLKAEMIEREDSPKFLITTNYLFRCGKNDASTEARFYEYKFKPYYNASFTPKDEFNEMFFEDWDSKEWNKFYSYIFRCVRYYLIHGLQRISYDKTLDNFHASFGNDVRLSEMKRIIDVIDNSLFLKPKHEKCFNVSDFLKIYNEHDNLLRNEKLFQARNTQILIDLFFEQHPEYEFTYQKRNRKWWKN